MTHINIINKYKKRCKATSAYKKINLKKLLKQVDSNLQIIDFQVINKDKYYYFDLIESIIRTTKLLINTN